MVARALLTELREGTVVVDGAMGTQLYERGILYSACFEELCVSRPELVRKIHEDYLRAGAQLIETNTFGANALRLEKHGLQARVAELNVAAVKLAREAAGAGKAWVGGAMGPSGYFLGEALDADLRRVGDAFREQAEALVGAGVDALVVETMRQSAELRLAIQAARAAVEARGGKTPVVAHVSVDEAGRMADGTSARDIGKKMIDWGADVIGVNCSDGPMNVLAAVEPMLSLGVPVSAVPNAGLPRRVDDRLVYVSTPEYFGVYARRLFKLGVKLVGGCCGTTPEHVKRIAAAARMVGSDSATVDEARERDSEVPVAILAGASLPPAVAERSTFGSKLGKKFVVSVEVNPPVGLALDKQLAAAKMLRDHGVDVINIADGARAQARMGNLAMASRVQRELGMETILHVCGRDRNLLGSLAHLLAAHELGVRNLVIITGDPPKMGDFPDATPVYDMDSIGLLKLASRLNHGIDPSGKPIGEGTRFVLATGAEPAALNYDRELRRLAEKKEAGAELVMTQPVYDPAQLRRFLRDAKPLGLPVLVGILPLASHRNAEFLHNEVPGMQVPEAVRERMRKVGSGPDARREGVAIAREMLSEVRSEVAGAYVMPPFERYELALEVVEGFV